MHSVTPVTRISVIDLGCHNNQMRYLPLLLLLITFPAQAETVYQGNVVKIADGDTLTLLVDNQQHKIRLSDIDTPERKQPFGSGGGAVAEKQGEGERRSDKRQQKV